MALGIEVGLGPGHIVLDGVPPLLPPKRDRAAQFSAHFYCGQTAVCVKIPLGTEIGMRPTSVGLRLGGVVLHGNPVPPPLKGAVPNFRPMSVVTKRLDGRRCHLVWR